MKAWSRAAELRALAVVDALALDPEPGLVEPAGDGVDLDAERRHREGVDDVGADHLHADDGADRHDHLVVDGEQARLVGRIGALVRPAACSELNETSPLSGYS